MIIPLAFTWCESLSPICICYQVIQFLFQWKSGKLPHWHPEGEFNEKFIWWNILLTKIMWKPRDFTETPVLMFARNILLFPLSHVYNKNSFIDLWTNLAQNCKVCDRVLISAPFSCTVLCSSDSWWARSNRRGYQKSLRTNRMI